MHRRLIALVAAAGLAVGAGLFAAPAAQAEGGFCYDLDVVVNGDAVVDESGCESIEAPALPALP